MTGFRVSLPLATIAVLAACATPHRITPTAYQKDQWTCEHQSMRPETAPLMALALYHDCMHAHGWSK